MATNFPTSLDSLTNPTASDKLNSVTVPHASQHATLNDAVEALEAKVGVDGSSVVTSHDYLIDKQSVVPYDDASARTTAVPSPVEGQMSYLKDTNSVEVYDGSAWTAVGGGLSYGTATGGSSSTITVGGESYTLLTFTSSGNLTVTADGVFDFVVVGGGGKGGEGYYADSSGGGAGGGGVITGTVGLTAGTHAIVIGAGGTTNFGNPFHEGEPGSASSLAAIEAAGGGGGGGARQFSGSIPAPGVRGWALFGGSGGGIMNATFTPGEAVGIQGNDGGTGVEGGSSSGGGGGGYTSAGGNGSGSTGGAGGNGYDPTTFTGSTITTAFGAGGGGAGSTTGGTGGSSSAGGDGGGGTNGSNAANYGNGGGGADYNYTGGNGSNGIVLVRFKN